MQILGIYQNRDGTCRGHENTKPRRRTMISFLKKSFVYLRAFEVSWSRARRARLLRARVVVEQLQRDPPGFGVHERERIEEVAELAGAQLIQRGNARVQARVELVVRPARQAARERGDLVEGRRRLVPCRDRQLL